MCLDTLSITKSILTSKNTFIKKVFSTLKHNTETKSGFKQFELIPFV